MNATFSANISKLKFLPGLLSQRMTPPKGESQITGIMSEHQLRGKDILGIEDLSLQEITLILEVAAKLKKHKFDETQTRFAKGQTLAMLFEKPSLRTKVTFEAGMTQLGGHAIMIEGKLGVRESVPDVARNLDRWLDGIMARTFSHQTLVELADNANIPVINGLSDKEHPCQALADFQTMMEHKGKLKGLHLTYIGDGNNVSNSLALLSAKLGVNFTVACPSGYEPSAEIWNSALEYAEASGAKLNITHSAFEAAVGADAIYTDVWASMGQESQSEERAKVFAPFQVNANVVKQAKCDAIVMHCLPAHRGLEITDEIIDGHQSVVFDQAENRLHTQKAILSLVL